MIKFFVCLFAFFLTIQLSGQETIRQYLSGTGNDKTVDWEFFLTEGRNSGFWTTIPVPSQWELEGFGQYDYGHVPLEEKGHEKGLYRYRFNVGREMRGKVVFIVFEGSMTDTEVKINGRSAGPAHQGAFYRFSYDISDLLNYGGENLLEVTVSKMSSNYSINMAERQADYWVFGGIFRPVYLKIKPAESIDHVAIDARADGSLRAHVYTGELRRGRRIQGQLFTMDGESEGSPFYFEFDNAQGRYIAETFFQNPELWSPEWPNLYRLEVSLTDGRRVLHTINERIGFRTVEVRENDGIYVNGERIMFRGVNRHSFWPASGRTTSKELSITDVNLMKDMNMNAVRMAHYPPDKHFLDVCDSLGLFVINELAGWQEPPYDTDVGRILVKSMIKRDVNHPSIIIWANGNERGHNYDLDDYFFQYDIQNRAVIHPIHITRGLDNNHYRPHGYGAGTFYNGYDIFFPTEFLHGLYDGGHGAGLDDHWNLMLSNPLSAGMFLWDFTDQGVIRTDLDGILDTDGNHGADGILGPYREKEGSYFTVKEIWSPVNFPDMKFIPRTFTGRFLVQNRFTFTNLDKCTFTFQLVDFPGPDDLSTSMFVRQNGKIASPSVDPGLSGWLELSLPADWHRHDALYITAADPHGREIFTWSWPIKMPDEVSKKWVNDSRAGVLSAEENDYYIIVSNGDLSVRFNKNNGLIEEIRTKDGIIPFSGGPVLTDENPPFANIELTETDSSLVVDVLWQERRNSLRTTWTLSPAGWLELEYNIARSGRFDYMGITFDFPEEKVNGMKWMGRGPYRVWKNRLKGQQFGVWHKDYNNTVTGESWIYPEFKGYHSDMYWVVMETDEQPVTVVFATPGMYLHMLTPDPPVDAFNQNTQPPFPAGDISFLHAISPIGTKFRRADEHGPQGLQNMLFRRVGGRIFFRFGN
jgi:hypothetical protein